MALNKDGFISCCLPWGEEAHEKIVKTHGPICRRYWPIPRASHWLYKHGLVWNSKVDVKTNFIRFCQFHPSNYKKYRIKKIKPTVELVIVSATLSLWDLEPGQEMKLTVFIIYCIIKTCHSQALPGTKKDDE